MATASVKTITKIVETTEKEVTLILSQEEVETLDALVQRVGGHPEESRRKYADQIRRALRLSGINGGEPSDIDPVLRAIYFTR